MTSSATSSPFRWWTKRLSSWQRERERERKYSLENWKTKPNTPTLNQDIVASERETYIFVFLMYIISTTSTHILFHVFTFLFIHLFSERRCLAIIGRHRRKKNKQKLMRFRFTPSFMFIYTWITTFSSVSKGNILSSFRHFGAHIFLLDFVKLGRPATWRRQRRRRARARARARRYVMKQRRKMRWREWGKREEVYVCQSWRWRRS